MIRGVMSRRRYDSLVQMHGANYAAWEYFSEWCKLWREAHPGDDRGDLALVDVFARDVESGARGNVRVA